VIDGTGEEVVNGDGDVTNSFAEVAGEWEDIKVIVGVSLLFHFFTLLHILSYNHCNAHFKS